MMVTEGPFLGASKTTQTRACNERVSYNASVPVAPVFTTDLPNTVIEETKRSNFGGTYD